MLHNVRREPPSKPEPKLRPKPERLGKRKVVTIALGILCTDGIVLCADSQETLTFSKVNRPKVFELKGPSDEMRVVLAGAGDGVFLDALKDKIEGALALPGVSLNLDSIHAEIEATVAGYCEKIWKIYGDHSDRPDAQMLIGIRAQDGLAMLHCDGPKIRRVSDYESIGFGGDFSAYHLKKLFNPKMSITEACPIAIHVLEVVKDNVDYCGGPSQVYVIPLTGEVQRKDAEYLYIAELAVHRTAHFADKLVSKAASLVRNDLDPGYDMEDFFEWAWPWLEEFIKDSEEKLDGFITELRAEWAQEHPAVSEDEIRDAQAKIRRVFAKPRRKDSQESESAPESDGEDKPLPF